MTNYIYHSKDVRGCYKTQKDDAGHPIIRSWLEVKKWFGWVKTSSGWNIDFRVRKDSAEEQYTEELTQRILIYRNPSISYYNTGGVIEKWDESTLDIRKRLTAVGERFMAVRNEINRQKEVLKELANA